MKRCSKCKAEKPESEFHRTKHTKSGLTCQCKECRNASSMRWLEANREEQRALSLRHYRENRDSIAARRSAKRYEHLEERLACERAAREKNREKYRGTCALGSNAIQNTTMPASGHGRDGSLRPRSCR